nr:prolyl oligopeptidase family serine peptidase [Paenibacillus bovis]
MKIVQNSKEHSKFIGESNSNQLLNHYIKLHYFQIQEIVVAPNDQEIIIVVGNSDMPHSQYAYGDRNRSIWNYNLKSNQFIKLTSPNEDAHAPCWSPDSKYIAYCSRASGKKELWIMKNDGSSQKQLTNTNFPGQDPFNGSHIEWSPDGNNIIYSVIPNGSVYGLFQSFLEEQEEDQRIQVDSGKNRRMEIHQKARSIFESELYVYNLKSRTNNKIASHNKHTFTIVDWYDNNKHLMISNGSELKILNIETSELTPVFSGQLGLVKILGTRILLARQKEKHIEIGTIDNDTFNKVSEAVVVGNDPVILQAWSNDGTKLYFTSQDGVSNILYSVDVNSGEVQALTDKEKVVWDYRTWSARIQSFHNSKAIIFPYSGPREPNELWKMDSNGEQRKLSHFCEDFIPTNLPEVRHIKYNSSKWKIESLLVLPKNYDSTKTYPTLVYLHGGPESFVTSNISELISGRAQSAAYYLAEHGYAVLLPNFRGSGGYGKEFENELSGYKITQHPFEDVMAGVDYLIKEGIADERSLGIYGSSFGAWLTAWTISQTNRFSGAIGASGIYDILDIDRKNGTAIYSIRENRKKNTNPDDMWVNPGVYKKFSPVEQVHHINTPMLLIETGAERRNGESCAKSLFNGILAQNVKTNLIYYPEAFHNGGWNDEYKRDYMMRLVAWFDHCIKGADLPDWF